MRRYLLSSAALHFTIAGIFLLFSWFHRFDSGPQIMDIDFLGDGGGGDGREGGGKGGPRPEQIGQIVPQPVKVPIPSRPAPVQKAISAQETWKIKNAKEIKKEPPAKVTPEVPIERGEKAQEEKTNLIRRGVDKNTTAGEDNFSFGDGPGTGGGNGDGKGLGVDIGFDPGEGGGFGGFGSYLRILRQRIWSEWSQISAYGTSEVCIVGLTVDRSGDVSDIRIEKASNNAAYDNVALRAVRNASPLPPLPSSFPKDTQRFRIKFRLIE
jgi:TonB family protein